MGELGQAIEDPWALARQDNDFPCLLDDAPTAGGTGRPAHRVQGSPMTRPRPQASNNGRQFVHNVDVRDGVPFPVGMAASSSPRDPAYAYASTAWVLRSSHGQPTPTLMQMQQVQQIQLPVPQLSLPPMPVQHPPFPPQPSQYTPYPYVSVPPPPGHFQCPTCRCSSPYPPQPPMMMAHAPNQLPVMAGQGGGAGLVEPDTFHIEQPPIEEGANANGVVGRKKSRCRVPGCGKLNKGRGLCKHHGGGRRCAVEGCERSARGAEGLCIGHGGGPRCAEPGCVSSARNAGGYCKRHGGGRRCEVDDCKRLCVANGETCSEHAPQLPQVPHTDGLAWDDAPLLAALRSTVSTSSTSSVPDLAPWGQKDNGSSSGSDVDTDGDRLWAPVGEGGYVPQVMGDGPRGGLPMPLHPI